MPSRLSSQIRKPKLRAGIYARVSRDKREGRSTTQQVDILTHESTEAGEEIVDTYVDNDRSASQFATREREDWERLMDDIKAGKLDVLRGWEIARLTRDREVWAPLIRACQDQHMYIGIGGRIYDTRDASDMFYLDILVATAVKESGDAQSRVNRDIAANARAGGVHGPTGYGFIREYDPETGNLVRQVPHPEQADIIEETAERLLGGDTLYAVARDLNARRVPTWKGLIAGDPILDEDGEPVIDPVTGQPRLAVGWTPQTVRQVMERKSLIGVRVHREQEYPGRWPAILGEETWWAVQDRIATSPSERPTSIKYLLSGLAVCDVCDGRMYMIPRKRAHPAYQCRGVPGGTSLGHVLRSVPVLEGHVEELLFERFSDPDVIEAFHGDTGGDEAHAAAMAAQRAQQELDDLYERVETGQVSWRMAQAAESRLQRELESAQTRAQHRVVDPLVASLAVPGRGGPERQWRAWNLHQRRLVLSAAAAEIRVLQVGRTGRRQLAATESVSIVWAGE